MNSIFWAFARPDLRNPHPPCRPTTDGISAASRARSRKADDRHTQPTHTITTKHDELQGAVEAMKRALPAYLELAALNAQVRRSHYDAYIAQGFTETQALILCQKVTL